MELKPRFYRNLLNVNLQDFLGWLQILYFRLRGKMTLVSPNQTASQWRFKAGGHDVMVFWQTKNLSKVHIYIQLRGFFQTWLEIKSVDFTGDCLIPYHINFAEFGPYTWMEKDSPAVMCLHLVRIFGNSTVISLWGMNMILQLIMETSLVLVWNQQIFTRFHCNMSITYPLGKYFS